VPQSKTLGDIAYRRGRSIGPSRNLQQELMLLRLKVKLRRGGLTEVEEESELVAKLCQYLKPGF
jgi:hypothetical protein